MFFSLRRIGCTIACFFSLLALPLPHLDATTKHEQPHSLVLFVADGLRAGSVTNQDAPHLYQFAHDHVWFANSHSLWPTVTTANASALATGHSLGDTGDFANSIDAGFILEKKDNQLVFLEDNHIIDQLDSHYHGNYLAEDTFVQAAQKKGWNTVVIGKLGPAKIISRNDKILLIDDSFDASQPSYPDWLRDGLQKMHLPLQAPPKGHAPQLVNRIQQHYYSYVLNQVILPHFKQENKPFVVVFWSRDPDGTQHAETDSPGKLIPGINGPTAIDAVHNADETFDSLLQGLSKLHLLAQTNILVAADHGFSVIAKRLPDQTPNSSDLPTGFLALDLGHQFQWQVYDVDQHNKAVTKDESLTYGNALLGASADHPSVWIASNAGSDLIYIAPTLDKSKVADIVQFLSQQPYVAGLFVRDDLGSYPEAFPMSKIGLIGGALTPTPAIVVNFRHFNSGCGIMCSAIIADTNAKVGQGSHGNLNRAETFNFMAAGGPSFKKHFVDPAPVSNADFGASLFYLLGASPSKHGHLIGRMVREALLGQKVPVYQAYTMLSTNSRLYYQQLDDFIYVDSVEAVPSMVENKLVVSPPAH